MSEARIVVVDDHPLVLDGVADALQKRGHRIAKARSLAEARALLAAGERFEAALLDINLGQENGLELLDAARGKLAHKVILLSGLAEQEWILKGFEAGAIGFIPKSAEMEQVVEAVGALLQAPHLPASGWVWSTAGRRLVEAREFFPAHTVLTPAESRRNVATRGIDLNALVGREFRIGPVRAFGQRLCEPCVHLQRLTRPGVVAGLVHKGGLRADLLSGGEIRVGDRIEAAD